MSAPDCMTCPTCAGRGTVELPEGMRDVLAYLRLAHSAMTATAIRDGLVRIGKGRVRTTTINNRLEDLRSLGYVTRVREGRAYLYSPARAS